MAPKRSNPIENPPAISSSEEEEEEEEVTSSEEEKVQQQQQQEGSSEEEEDDEEEEDEDEEPKTQSTPLTQKSPPPKKPEISTLANDVDESDETESDSESESDSPSPNVKPIATKPMEETSNAKRPRSKPSASPPVKASTAKRPNESEPEAKDAKRSKKKAGEDGTASAEEVKKTGEDAKKQLFQRLFTEDDEIALLKGMLDYFAKKGADPVADMNAFYDFVKKSIHTDVTKAQLMDKVRRLRKKYENNAGKGKKGEDRTFSKPHEQKAFELSKMIWGKDGISVKVEASAAKSNAGKSDGKAKGKSKPVVALKAELPSSPEKVDHSDPMEVDKKISKSSGCLFVKRFGVSGMEEEVIRNGFDVIGGEKKAALEERWRKLQIAELELFLQRNELVKEHAKSLLEFYKSEDR